MSEDSDLLLFSVVVEDDDEEEESCGPVAPMRVGSCDG